MDWILEQSLGLYQSFVKGELSSEKVLSLLVPVLFVGIVLARKSIWQFVRSQSQRIQEYVQLQETKRSLSREQERANNIAKEIEEKLDSLQESKILFSIKVSEILKKIETPSFVGEIEANGKNYLRDNVVYLDKTYEESLDTIREIEHLLKDIAEVKYSDVMEKNRRQMTIDSRRRREAKKSANSVKQDQM